MQGIYLFRLKKFVVNLKRLNEYFDLFIVTRILDEMNQKSEKYFIGQSSETESLFEFLHDEFNQAYNYSTLPDSADNQEKLLNAYLRSMR
jgi:thioredoxin-related protein